MTRNDFEIIASVLAEVESELEEMPGSKVEKETALACHRFVITKLAERFKLVNPRFDAGTFDIHAAPIRNARLKASIIAKLEGADNV